MNERARIALRYGRRVAIDNDSTEGRPYGHPKPTTKAWLFIAVAEAVEFAEGLRETHRAAGRRRSVRVLPRGISADNLQLSTWIVVQRKPAPKGGKS